MAKAITLKDALKKWAEREIVAEATVVKLNGWIPCINKLDASLGVLTNCEQLSLSTNMIDKLTNLNLLTKLKILSVGRNNLKTLNGVEYLAETLEQLWASYNNIETLKPLASLKKLTVIYMSNNKVKAFNELKHLAQLPLEDLVFRGCPISEKNEYQSKVAEILPTLKKLDAEDMVASN